MIILEMHLASSFPDGIVIKQMDNWTYFCLQQLLDVLKRPPVPDCDKEEYYQDILFPTLQVFTL